MLMAISLEGSAVLAAAPLEQRTTYLADFFLMKKLVS